MRQEDTIRKMSTKELKFRLENVQLVGVVSGENVERSILEDINRQLHKKEAEAKAKEEGNKLDSAEG